jgi:DNA polymerase III delta prime subunit
METRLASKPILTIIERTFNKLKDSQLSQQNAKKLSAQIKGDLEIIAKFFGCNQEEALFFSLIFGLKVVINSVYYNDLIHYLDCNPFFIVSNEHIFKSLQKKKLIIKDDNWGRNSISLNITREAYNAVAANKPLQQNSPSFDSFYALLQKTEDLISERRREIISTYELFDEIRFILENETKIPIIGFINKLHLNVKEATLLLYLCYQFANGDEHTDLNEMLSMVFDSMSDRVHIKKELLNKEAALIKHELVEFENDYFLIGRSIKLTDQAIDKLFTHETDLFDRAKTFKPALARLITAQSIKPKQIFLNPEEKKQVEVLEKLLHQEKLGKIIEQFDQAGIAKGIVVLLYGEPGTGKTETVYNLAHATGRHLMIVDIAGMKDKYVGESEKRIKQLFDEYKKACAYFEQVPILLFNESDAIISKRIEVSSSVDQMNNSIQNIILQELEDFEGILFATSNMQLNLDKAFERRFLYKVQFKLPNAATREKIWQHKLPELMPADSVHLASKFTFSGGQIDNVARKYLLEKIIQDKEFNLTKLENLCEEELFGNHSSRIGF